MERVDCNLCGSGDLRYCYSKPDVLYAPDTTFDVVECRVCGLGFLNPRPTYSEIWRHYPPDFYAYFEREHDRHTARYAAEAGYLKGTRGGTTRRLLDVGCAEGAFPRFMRARGWDVAGVEASPVAKKITDFPVYSGWFPDMPSPTEPFDAVTAWAVLEHVHDPRSYFRKAGSVLRSGGQFVFLVTNFDSLASRYLYCEDIPRHLYFFTEETVRRYLADAGMSIDRIHYTKAIYSLPPHNWLRYSLRRVSGRKLSWPLPETYGGFLRRTAQRHSVSKFASFALHSPLSAIDRAFVPLVERWEIWRRSYGIVVYVARKSHG